MAVVLGPLWIYLQDVSIRSSTADIFLPLHHDPAFWAQEVCQSRQVHSSEDEVGRVVVSEFWQCYVISEDSPYRLRPLLHLRH